MQSNIFLSYLPLIFIQFFTFCNQHLFRDLKLYTATVECLISNLVNKSTLQISSSCSVLFVQSRFCNWLHMHRCTDACRLEKAFFYSEFTKSPKYTHSCQTIVLPLGKKYLQILNEISQLHSVNFQILSLCLTWLVYVYSLIVLRFERKYSLPSVPTRGHGLVLLTFWSLIFIFENLSFVNLGQQSWWFKLKE